MYEFDRPTNSVRPKSLSMPGWVKDHAEAMGIVERERQEQALEARFPGVKRAFRDLVESLPSQEDGPLIDFPVRAAIFRPRESGKSLGTIVSNSLNIVNDRKNSTLHAEMVAIQEAMAAIEDKHLRGLVLLTTCEPCIMCAGAAVRAEVDGVVYGVYQDDMRGKHVLVDRKYKPFGAEPEGYNAAEILIARRPDMVVYGGLEHEEVKKKMSRTPLGYSAYFADPDI